MPLQEGGSSSLIKEGTDVAIQEANMTVKDQNKKQLILKGNVGDTNYKNKDRISNQSDLAAEYYDNLNGVKPIDDTI